MVVVPVEIGSGVGGLVYAWILGRRMKRADQFPTIHVSGIWSITKRLRSYTLVFSRYSWWFIGTPLCYGSGGLASTEVVHTKPTCSYYGHLNSMICSAFGGMAWCLFDYALDTNQYG